MRASPRPLIKIYTHPRLLIKIYASPASSLRSASLSAALSIRPLIKSCAQPQGKVDLSAGERAPERRCLFKRMPKPITSDLNSDSLSPSVHYYCLFCCTAWAKRVGRQCCSSGLKLFFRPEWIGLRTRLDESLVSSALQLGNFLVRISPNIRGGKLKSHGIWWQTSEYTLNQDGKCRRVFGTMRDTLCISPLSRVKRAPSEVISARRPQKTVNGMRSFLHFIRMFYFTSTPTRVLDHQGFIFWKDAHVNESLRSRCPLLAKTHLTSWWVQRFFNIPV